MRYFKPLSLTRRADFIRVQTQGHRWRSNRVVLLIDPGVCAKVRVGYTVSRRVGNAVVRNRIRRQLREIVRLHQETLVQGWDYVLVATPRAVASDYSILEKEVVFLLDAACSEVKLKVF
ncbi:MAG: ribonuclease P protein component [Deltaproteobacteria bacterium]|nr:ribonuclease P protein component [Deltaproteobacteria bacterium]